MINTTVMRAGRNALIGAMLCTTAALAVGTIATSTPDELRTAAFAAAQSHAPFAPIDHVSAGARATGPVKGPRMMMTTVTDAPGQSDEHRCVVEYVKAHARTEHGATHANAKAACATPDAPATYTRTITRDLVAPGGAKFGIAADTGDVVLSADMQVTPGWTYTLTPNADATGAITSYGVRVDSDPSNPDGATGQATLTITVSDVATTPAA